MAAYFTIDGMEWEIPCKIERVAEIKASEISGLMLDRSYYNDVLGTYLTYTITLAVPLHRMDDYATLYEILTKPVDGHVLVVPYNNADVTIVARVTEISDVYVRLPQGGKAWKGLRFVCVGNNPTKEQTLSGIIQQGRTPLPDVQFAEIGDVYEFTAAGWVKVAEESEGEGE